MIKVVTKKQRHEVGFTLIEVLVVLVIISVLAAIGITKYTSLLAKTRDTARRAYLNELVTTLEVNKDGGRYKQLETDQISSLSSIDTAGNAYCIATNIPPDPSYDIAWGSVCPDGFEVIAAGVPEGNFSEFKVCTYLEKPEDGQANVFCKSGSLDLDS